VPPSSILPEFGGPKPDRDAPGGVSARQADADRSRRPGAIRADRVRLKADAEPDTVDRSGIVTADGKAPIHVQMDVSNRLRIFLRDAGKTCRQLSGSLFPIIRPWHDQLLT
jgi:hypothetical protein